VADELSLGVVERVAEDLAQHFLGPYTVALKGKQIGRKEVNDALWGTIVLTPVEVALLDSPLLQRLRFVRQLGVVHWIYPGAGHSRFEHALGMLFQMQQLISALNTAWKLEQQSSENPSPLIDDSWAQLLRLSALLHDVGHVAFSGVSESALEDLPAFLTVSSEFTKALLEDGFGDDRNFSEILAYYIVRSPAMRCLFDELLSAHAPRLHLGGNRQEISKQVVELIASALIGRKIDDRRPLLHELVSGPYDVDLLDQLVRDARLAGTPSLLDIPRLMQKLAVRKMRAGSLPQEIAGQVRLEEEDDAFLFGVKISGASVLNELQLAQVLTDTKIYRHPKVTAVAQMVRAFVRAISKLVTPDQLLHFLYAHADDAMLAFSDAALIEALKLDAASLNAEARKCLASAGYLLKAIRERHLWVQAFQFPGDYVFEEDADPREEGLDAFLELLRHPEEQEALMAKVRDEIHVMLETLGNAHGVSRTALDAMMMVNIPGPIAGETRTGRAFLIQKSGGSVQLARSMKVRGDWAEQYMSGQPKASIYCSQEVADLVYIAIEKLVRTEQDARLPSWFTDTSKRNRAELQDMRTRLNDAGYFSKLPFDLRPMPERVVAPDVGRRLSRFENLRKSFQEPVVLPEADGSPLPMALRITPDKRTKAWLRQFEHPDHIDCAITLLENFRILGRQDTVAALQRFFESHNEFRDAWVVPFGSMKDSSVIDAYFARDLGYELVASVGSLDEYAEKGDGKPLVFIDNFTASGNQATDIMAAWFGRDDLRREELGEKRDPLEPRLQELLLKRPVAFAFVAAWQKGLDAVSGITEKLGLNATVFSYLPESELPYAQSCLEKASVDPGKITRFMERCRQIGTDLVRSQPRATPLDAGIVEQRALGYGERGMLLATPVNIPTQTLTAVWMTGTVGDVEWTPLFGRRKKR